MVPEGDRPGQVEDLLTLVSAAIGTIGLIFTLVLYAHYTHLQSTANHALVWVGMGASLVTSAGTFLNVFAFPGSDQRFSTAHCEAQAFLYEVFSDLTIAAVIGAWCSHTVAVLGHRASFLQRNGHVVALAAVGLVAGCIGGSLVLALGFAGQQGQSWCSCSSPPLVLALHILPTIASIVPATLSVGKPLCSHRINRDQKGLLMRRYGTHCLWVGLRVFCAVASISDASGIKAVQAALCPMSGLVLAGGFLYSERMLTLRALGLPPGVDPPSGFTGAMYFVPDRLLFTDAETAVRDPTVFHEIRS